MNDSVPAKMDILMSFFPLQQRVSMLLLESEASKNRNDLGTALEAYEQLISTLCQQLQLAETNNRHYPDSPFDTQPIVNTLLNALLVEADVLEARGDLARAEERREEASDLSQKYLLEAEVAERERQQAGALISQGRFNEALVALTSARDLFQTKNDALNMASVTANLADILEWLGDYERALTEARRASKFLEPLIAGTEPSGTDVLASLLKGDFGAAEKNAKLWKIFLELAQVQARVNRYLGRVVEAEKGFRKIIPQIPEGGRVGIEFQLAALAISAGRYQEGLGLLSRMEPLFKGLARPKWGVLMSFKAEALLGLHQPDQARKILDAALADLSQYRDPDSLWKAQWRQGRAWQALHQPAAALKAFAQAIDTVMNLRKAPLGYRLDSTYLKDKLPLFEAAIELAVKSSEAELGCRFIEAIKARTLTAALGLPAVDQPKKAGDLNQQVDQLTSQIDALEYTAYREGWTEEIEQKKASLLSARASLLERIRFSDPRWRSLSEPLAFDLPKVLAGLNQRGQAALTLFYQPHQVLSVLLKDNRCLAAGMRMGENTKEVLEKYRQNLQMPEPNVKWFDPASGLDLGGEHLVPANLLHQALQAKSLIIVPHGPLHLIPWAGLAFQGKRLFEYCAVGILPNLTCLSNLRTDLPTAPRVAIIGAPDYRGLERLKPLPHASIELQTIQDIYRTKGGVIGGNIIKGREATEANFWRLAVHEESPGNIFHLCSHGIFVGEEPLSSGLLFTDAKVDAAEIARSRLRYDEVILSACSTGYRPTEVQGVKLSGDDILGLPGALLEAGTRSVLVSIPPARDDATLHFMTLYHENRAEGDPPLFALQRAQKSMLRSAEFPPQLWIGFTLYGCQ